MPPPLRPEAMFALLAVLPADTRTRMVRMYHASLAEQAGLLQAALASSDAAAAQAISHKLAGSAAMMQDSALSRAARNIEAALREGREPDANEEWDRLAACAAVTLDALAADGAMRDAAP